MAPSEKVSVEQIQLDELVDPFEAKLDVYRAPDGTVDQVAFDLSGLPRIDGMLVGKRAVDVPDITKRLCGLCPVVHHLAGVRAVEALFSITEIPRTARLIRQLLCAGSTLDSLATKFIATDRDTARAIKRAGQACLRAAGSPTHFPDVAVPGGVRKPADETLVAEARKAVALLLASGTIVGSGDNGVPSGKDGLDGSFADIFPGLDIAVVDADGSLDPLGDYLGVAVPGEPEARVFAAAEWGNRVRETVPGIAAPRPAFDFSPANAPCTQQPRFYRVGPIARLAVVGRRGASPAAAQEQLLADTAQRAAELLDSSDLLGEEILVRGAQEAVEAAGFEGSRTGVGIVDGPRGLLVHRYTAAADGIITDCQIMTPTAQNELWLTEMLTERMRGSSLEETGSGAKRGDDGIEESIWAADPCLPCSSAPAGLMTFKFEERSRTK